MWIDLLINSLSNNFSLFQLKTKTTFYKQCWPNMVSIWKKLYLKCHYPLINYPNQLKKTYFPKGALIVKLCDEFPDGQTRLISFGVMNLTHYKSDEKPEQLRTGNW